MRSSESGEAAPAHQYAGRSDCVVLYKLFRIIESIDQVKSDLFGVYSISTGPSASEILIWYGLGRKHTVNMYRLLIPEYDQLDGDEKMFAEDTIDFLFTRSEILELLRYLTRHDKFGDRHIVARAEDPAFERLQRRARDQCQGTFDLDDDWHNPFEVFGVSVGCTKLPFSN